MDSHGGQGPSCFICLSRIDFTRKPGPSSQILKLNANSLSTLGKVFNISNVFIDPFLSASRGGERPLQCGECLKCLSQLSGVQEQLGSLTQEVQRLQNQLLVKLKQLAKVVGVSRRNKKSIHENLIKTEKQLQGAMGMKGGGGGFCGGLVSPELYSLRQLVLGALMISGSEDHLPDIPNDVCSSTSFPDQFVVSCGARKCDDMGQDKSEVEVESDLSKCTVVKVEPIFNVHQMENNGETDNDMWNGYILVNEDEPSQMNGDDFVYGDEDAGDDVVVSDDGGSDYTPSPTRKTTGKRNKLMEGGTRAKRRRTGEDSCSDSDVDESTMIDKHNTPVGGRSVMTLLRTLQSKMNDHDNTLKRLLRDKAFVSGLSGEVEEQVKETLAALKCEDLSVPVETDKFNGLVDQVEKCFSNHSVLRKKMVDMKSAFQGSLKKVTERNSIVPTNGSCYQVNWPLNSKEGIEVVEKQLEDSEFYKAEVQALSRVGGNSRRKIVFNTLRTIITDDLAQNVRFTNKTGKIAFGDLKLASLVRDAIKLGNPLQNFTDGCINMIVGCWLRQSVDRKRPLDKRGKPSKKTKKGSKSLSNEKDAEETDNEEFDSLLM